jgi:hypothetical protein
MGACDMRTWGKRILGVGLGAVALAIGSDLWLHAMPSVDPPATAAEWKLAVRAVCGNTSAPHSQFWRGTSQARRVCQAEYAGSPSMRLTLFEMPEWAGATAFDAFQKWRPSQPGKMAFYKGRYFGVVESPQAGRAALDRFVVAVENTLPGSRQERW